MNFLRTHILLIAAYVVVLAALAISVAIATLALGKLGVGLHLLLAFVMAITIAALFMGIRYLGALLRVFALGGLLFLLFMWIIMPIDYFTR